MLPKANSYEECLANFSWAIPDHYNIGVDVCDRQDPTARALIFDHGQGEPDVWTFGDFKKASNKLANALTALGLNTGDRVGILLGQRPETATGHLACFKAGLISIPLFTLFGPDALQFRLANAEAKAVITDRAGAETLATLRGTLPALAHVIVIQQSSDGSDGLSYESLIDKASDQFTPVPSKADDPALVIYTSGTTGNPKGALHAHRVLLGHLPGVEFPHDFAPQKGDLFWTPADWAWIGGLLDVLLPAWHHGLPVLAHRARKFDPEEAFHLMAKHSVRNTFLPPTALKLMRQVPDVAHIGHQLRSVASGGETLGAELLDWGRDAFGLTINEFYGQTECNLVVGNNSRVLPVRPGSMGKAIPGHSVAVIDPSGTPLPPGEAGLIAIHTGDPVMFLGYLNNPEATADKFIGDWLVTGDTGQIDGEGYLWFAGRDDDVITSAGYRIGPAEIEDCLLKHPAVQMAAAIGVPDPLRTEAVKACIVLSPGQEATAELAKEIQSFVKTQLAAHEYPRIVEFVEALPMTTTGKIMRRVLRQEAVERLENPHRELENPHRDKEEKP